MRKEEWRDSFLRNARRWDQKYIIFPRRSLVSNKLIFFEYAYVGVWRADMEYINECITEKEMVVEMIKGTVK